MTSALVSHTQWFPTAENDIMEICATYIPFGQFESGPCTSDDEFERRQQSNPLYSYVAQNRGYNARQASGLSLEIIRFLTPLSYAAKNGHNAVVQLLLTTGQVDADSKDNGRTPLSYAATNGHDTVLQRLLATGQVDADSEDKYGRTPLRYAAMNGHNTVVHRRLAMVFVATCEFCSSSARSAFRVRGVSDKASQNRLGGKAG